MFVLLLVKVAREKKEEKLKQKNIISFKKKSFYGDDYDFCFNLINLSEFLLNLIENFIIYTQNPFNYFF